MELAHGSPISRHLFLKISRSSVAMTVSIDVPSTETPCFFNTPEWSSSMPQLSAVWPPMLMRTASGFSLAMTDST